MKIVLTTCLLFFVICLQSQTMTSSVLNFTSFSAPKSKIVNEQLDEATPLAFKSNPEYGVLPTDASCIDCVELIHLRTDSTRQYVNGTQVYVQKGNCSINYVDANGFYRDNVRFMKPSGVTGEYEASNQKYPTFINKNSQSVSIKFGTDKFDFCKNLKLYFQDSLGVKTLLHSANWSGATVGDDGLFITNIFPNVDLQAQVMEGSFKTSFIVKNNLALSKKGWLIVSDEILAPIASTVSYASALDIDSKTDGNVYFNNPTGQNFSILQGIVTSSVRMHYASLYFRMAGSNFEMLTSSSWLNDTATHYPIIIDPVVTNANTLPLISITGSGFNNFGGFAGYCFYNLTVARPVNCTLTNITTTTSYLAQNGALRNDGAYKFELAACTSPTPPGAFWFCNLLSAGSCGGTYSLWTDLSACASPLATCTGNLTFRLRFYDRFAGAFCSNFFIAANAPWTMTLIGSTLETLGNSATGNGISNLTPPCNTTQLLNPAVTNGVSPYTYLWSPGGQITSTKTIPTFFLGTQTHSCTVTDACGVVRIATFNVTPTCVLPVELVSYVAEYNGNYVSIDWVTASEINSDYFTVEKSYDGLNYYLVEKIKAAGQSSSIKKYNVQDAYPNKKGFTYYRLKQFDNDRNEKFSKITSVEISEEVSDLFIVPNPNNGNFEVSLSVNLIGKTVDVEIYDVTGKKSVLKHNLTINASNRLLNLDISEMPKGVYFIKVVSLDGTSFKSKLIKE